MTTYLRPLLVYDGDCAFCRRWIVRWRRVTGERVDYAPYQEAAPRFPAVPLERFKSAVQLIEPDGRVSQAAEAALRSLAYAPGWGWLFWLYEHVGAFRAASEWGYRVVARNRGALSRLGN